AAKRSAGGVRETVNVLGGPLRIAAFALVNESGNRDVRTAVGERERRRGEVFQAQFARPVASFGTDRRVEVIRVVVAEAELVDPRRREDPRMSHCEVPAPLWQVGRGERRRL